MHTVLNSLVALIISILGAQGQTHSEPVQPLVVVGASDEQQARLDAATDAYDAAGLELPNLVIEFAPDGDKELCSGNAGLFRPAAVAGEAHSIFICYRSRITLLHELGHAWVAHNLDTADRQAYLEYWNISQWSDQSAKWSERGNERAANTIAYTLTLDETPANDNVNALVCGYEALTGTSHLNVAHADCFTATA